VANKQYTIEYLPIGNLHYDKQNPRLPHSVIDSDNDTLVIDWMLKDASIIELMGSIGEKGFFPAEPLLVVQIGKSKNYTVIEGNRRLTAVKLLNNPKLATRRSQSIITIVDEAIKIPKELPVMVFHQRKEILDYLGFKHITGVKQWSALAKAKYLKELQKEYSNSEFSISDQYKKLAKAIGSRADYVRDLLIGLDVYESIHKKKYFNIDDLNEETIEFGVYYNALKFGNIPKYIGIDKFGENPTRKINQKNLEVFTRIISEKDETGKTKLGESRNLTVLNDIILESRPRDMVLSGKKTLEEAALYLEGPQEVFRNSLSQIKSLLKDAEHALKEVVHTSQIDIKLITDIKQHINDVDKDVKRKLTNRKKTTS
jgi:hypothetical protein